LVGALHTSFLAVLGTLIEDFKGAGKIVNGVRVLLAGELTIAHRILIPPYPLQGGSYDRLHERPVRLKSVNALLA